MTTTAAAIDRLLQDELELHLTDTYVTTEWRPRALFALRKALGEIFLELPADQRYQTAPLSLVGPATDVDLPANFKKTGFKGGVFIAASSRRIYYLPSDKFYGMQNAAGVGGGLGEPEFYTLSGLGTATGRRQVTFFPAPAAGTTYSIRLRYEGGPPTLADNAVAGTNGLDLLDEDLYTTVIHIGAADWLLHGVGDARSISEISPRFKMALGQWISTVQAGQEELMQYGEEGVPELDMW